MDARTLEAARSTGAKLAVAAGLALLVFLGLGLLLFAGPAGAETCNAECPGDGGDGGAGDGGIGGGGSTTNNQWITFTVTNTNDSGDGSLRQALEVANLYSPSCIGITIGFNIPGEGVHTIRPASDLPPIPACVTVDGYSQPGAKANTLRQGNDAVLKIELNGENAGSRASGLRMDGTDSAVRGLAINRFAYYGVFLHGGRADYCDVQGNYIGTDATGTRDLGNKTAGVFIAGDSNTIGGTEPAARNVLSGNGTGVLINGSNNNVEGNYIGTKASGDEPLGNDWVGVSTPTNGFSRGNTIGGAVPAAGNLIAFNTSGGVAVHDPKTTILSNSVHSNGGLGIDLAAGLADAGVTPNDSGDGDTGPNGLQNYPEITSVTTGSGNLSSMEGRLNGTPNTKFTVQLFTGDEPDPSGYGEGRLHGEPDNLVSNWPVTTDANGHADLHGVWPPGVRMAGKWLTATATGPDGTSEFSKAVRIRDRNDPAPETTVDSGPSGPTRESTAAFAFSSSEANSAFQCRLDGAEFADCASPKEYPALVDGDHTFEVRAIDDAGNPDPTPETRAFTVDTVPPNTSISSGPAPGSTTRSTSASFGFVPSEPVSRFECSLDYAAFSPCASPKAYSGLTNRVHTFRVRAVDRAGNVDPAPSARTWTVDTTLPAIASPSPAPSSATQDRTPTVRATVRDTQTDLAKTGVQLYVDGIRRTTFSYDRATDRLSYTPATNLSYARHTAKVVARDAAGNTTTKSWSFGVTR